MKTIRFGRIHIDFSDDGDVVLTVSAPGQGTIELPLQPDEVTMFLAEVGNSLFVSRDIQRKLREARDLKREQRKGHK